ncbi:DivIVA domain-containing protein [Nocardia sp. NPDC049149]|uniref:DivIVA domain-containing protein n=1 Tax=Nocardia sp. NPDC049149 TaxID=3364315 RepID=UPI003714705B
MAMNPSEITPESIRDTQFKRSALGRRGYDEAQVDQFLRRVSTVMGQVVAANDRLTSQLQRGGRADLVAANNYLQEQVAELERQLLDRDANPIGGGPTVAMLWDEVESLRRENERLHEEAHDDVLGVNIRAVNMLSQAQTAAEATVNEAERYATELVIEARQHYAEILRQAQDSAGQAVGELAALTRAPAPGTTVSQAEVDYVRAYTQIAQKQLQSIVDAMCSEVDKLGRSAPPGIRGQPISTAAQYPSPIPSLPGESEQQPWNEPRPSGGGEVDHYHHAAS